MSGDMTGRASVKRHTLPWGAPSAAAESLVPSAFLHREPTRIDNPLCDRSLAAGEPGYAALTAILDGTRDASTLPPELAQQMKDGLWLVPQGEDLSRRYRLRYVSLEGHTVCNQACSFCPVSVDPRKPYFMPTALYERIVGELATYRDTIEGVVMNNYNEPTVDRRFIDQVRTIKAAGLPPAVLTNGSGLTPDRVDAIVAMGGLRYLSVNISTLDRETYARDRGVDQVDVVLRNLDHAKDKPVATKTDIVVLGTGDERHRLDHEEISRRFAGSRFNVKPVEVTDRAGYLPKGLKQAFPHRALRGCENLGSRPLEHLHVTAHGTCVFCCQDYDEKYVVGELSTQSVAEVLSGPEFARLRRFSYGLAEAPEDFICRKCIFARTDAV